MLSATVRVRGAVRAAGAVAVVAALAVALSACGGQTQYGLGGESSTATLPLVPAKPMGDPAQYDLIVLASAENNPLFADAYGMTLDPLAVERITVDKRVSTLDANSERIVVAAADGRTDRLAFVSVDGDLKAIPGIGRPFAYSPTFTDDGSFYFSDFRIIRDQQVNRFWRWDSAKQRKVSVFRTKRDWVGPFVGTRPDRGLAFGTNPGEQGNEIVIRGADGGQTRTFPVDSVISGSEWGADLIALSVAAEGSRFGDTPEALVLLNPESGEQTRVPGYQAVAWTPDGTKLLVRSTADLTSSVLSLLDPKNPATPEPLGTIPGLAIYSGAWVGAGR